jgi:hypothetical protein
VVPVGEGKYIQNLAMKLEGKVTFGIDWHKLENNVIFDPQE